MSLILIITKYRLLSYPITGNYSVDLHISLSSLCLCLALPVSWSVILSECSDLSVV